LRRDEFIIVALFLQYLFEIIEYLSYFLLICPRLSNSQTAIPRIKSQGRGINSKEFSGSCRKAQKFEVM